MKTHLQCGYENECKNKDCLKCKRGNYILIKLSLAEEIAIEDFAMCDFESFMKEKPEEFELLQKIMYNLMKKVFERKN